MDKIIIIGGSAGSFRIVNKILSALPGDYKLPLIICMHRLKNVRSNFTSALSLNSNFKTKEARDKEKISGSIAYIAPSNYHLMIEYGFSFCLSDEPALNHSRPSIDITMETAANVFRNKALGIILSGANSDGANGMQKIQNMGGMTIVQDPSSCEIKTMPESCLNLIQPDYVMNVESMINFIVNFENK